MLKYNIQFPEYSGLRCLMMPYIQGVPESVPDEYRVYDDVVRSVYIRKGDVGYLTIDESPVKRGDPHRGARAKFGRALHTEVGRDPNRVYTWGGGSWGGRHRVTLDSDVKILLANNLDGSCAIWYEDRDNTSVDGDIGDLADEYPYSSSVLMKSGEVHEIGILTPHESIPVTQDINRQFLRIVSSGVHGREEYFTVNPLMT